MGDKTSEPSSQTQIQLLMDTYKAAVFDKDTNRVMSLYADDVLVFDAWETWAHSGRCSWRALVAGWLGSLGEKHVSIDMDTLETRVDGNLAFARAILTYIETAPDGTNQVSVSNRLTWILERRGGKWLIVHEHTSVPVDLASGKIILQRGTYT